MNPRPDLSLAVLDSEEAVRMVAMWPAVQRTAVGSGSADPWDDVEYDLHEWANLARVSVGLVEALADSLIGAGLVLADGGVRTDAAGIVVEYVQRKRFELAFGRPPSSQDLERMRKRARDDEERREAAKKAAAQAVKVPEKKSSDGG